MSSPATRDDQKSVKNPPVTAEINPSNTAVIELKNVSPISVSKWDLVPLHISQIVHLVLSPG
jgi:hypothetical protein